MAISDQLTEIYNNVPLVYDAGYDAGYEKGKAEGGGSLEDNPLYYIKVKGFQWSNVVFPNDFNFVLNLKQKPEDMNGMLITAKGLKSVELICDVEGTVNYNQLIRETSTEILDLSKFKPTPLSMSYFCYLCRNLVKILGKIDMSACTTTVAGPFSGCTALQDIEFVPNTISVSIGFDESPNLSDYSIQSIIDGLITITDGVARTITFSQTVRNKLSPTQVDTIKNVKGWSLLPAEATN